MSALDWQESANCAGVSDDSFFPESGNHAGENIIRKYCDNCHVTAECLEYALTHDAGRFGIWGGMSQRDRDRLQGKRR